MSNRTGLPQGSRPEQSSTPLSSPKRAPLAFRVGVVGHRPDRLGRAQGELLAATLRGILAAVHAEVTGLRQGIDSPYDTGAAELRAISPLAEGSDRIFAEQAMDLGYTLCCVMPFQQAEFERDFTAPHALEPNSLERFRSLLDRAGETCTRFEMDGKRSHASAAYGAAGQVVLNQSDLLVVVWDGMRQGKRGGTEETLDQALHRGVPVVWVDAHAPHTWQLIASAADRPRSGEEQRVAPAATLSDAGLRSCVRAALGLPGQQGRDDAAATSTTADDDEPQRDLNRFYRERQHHRSFAFAWKIFRDLLGDARWPQLSTKVPAYEVAVEADWPRNPSTAVGEQIDRLRPYYAWADQLSVLYSDGYRSAFVLAFLLAAFAVGMALAPVALALPEHHWAEIMFTALEFVAIVVILSLIFVGRKRQWHERWMDYRLVAELVRHLRLVAPLGGERPFPQIPAHWGDYGHPGATWMAWYVRAVERAVGLPTTVVNKERLQENMAGLLALVESQVSFHAAWMRRGHTIHERLHVGGLALFFLTLVFCALHLVPVIVHHKMLLAAIPPASWLFALGGFLPALGAALAGINNQGEFHRIAKRSKAMHKQLSRLLVEIKSLQQRIDASDPSDDTQFSIAVQSLSGDVARVLVAEVLDWRVVLLDRPLQPPA